MCIRDRTYPRTDARVLSTAVAKEIYKNISGLRNFQPVSDFAAEVLEMGSYKNIAKTRYVNDKQDVYKRQATTRGLKEEDMDQIAEAIALTLKDFEANKEKAKAIIDGITAKYPLN